MLEVLPGQSTTSFDDVLVENCAFRNNTTHAVYFYGNSRPYAVNRFKFVRNTIKHPAGRGFLAGSGAAIRDMVLEDNYVDVAANGWRVPSRTGRGACAPVIRRSVNNTWIDNGGSSMPQTSEALGIATGTVVCQADFGDGAVVPIPDDVRMVRVAGARAAVTVTLQKGAFDAQQVVLVGTSDARPVTVPDTGNAQLGAARTLGAGDTLRLVWVEATRTWCEVGFGDN